MLLLFCLISCQEKKNIVLTGEEPVPAAEFIDFFAPFSLPHTIADTVLNDKLADSVRISIPVLRAMIPDSVYDKEYNKKVIKSRFNIVAPWPKPVFSATKMRIILKNRSGL